MKYSYFLIANIFIFNFDFSYSSLIISNANAQSSSMLEYQRSRAGITTKLPTLQDNGTKPPDENVIKQRAASYSKELMKLSDSDLKVSYEKFRNKYKSTIKEMNLETNKSREEMVRQMSQHYASNIKYDIPRILNEVGPETPEKKMLEKHMKSSTYSKYVKSGFSPVDFNELTQNLKLNENELKIAKQLSQLGNEGIHLAYDVHIGSIEGAIANQSIHDEMSTQAKLKKLAEFYSTEGMNSKFEKIKINVGAVIAAVHSPTEMNHLVDDVWDGKQYSVESNSRTEIEKKTTRDFFTANKIQSKSQLIKMLKVNPRKFLSLMSKFSILSIPGAVMANENEPVEQIHNPNAKGSNVGNSYFKNLNLKHRDEKNQSIK